MKFWWFQFWTITLTPGCYVPAVPKILDAELEIFVEKNYRLVLTGVISARAGHTVKQYCSVYTLFIVVVVVLRRKVRACVCVCD